MVAVRTYDQAKKWLLGAELSRQPLIGILMLFPGEPNADLILRRIQYYHERSDYHTAFFFAGCYNSDGVAAEETDAKEVGVLHGQRLMYSPSLYHQFVSDVEEDSSWRRSDETELLLTTAYVGAGTVKMLYEHSIALNLDWAVRNSAIDSVPEFFNKLFESSKAAYESNPMTRRGDGVMAVSDAQGMEILKDGLGEALLSLVPERLRRQARRAPAFAVKDFSKH